MGSTATELVKQFEMRYSKSDKKPDGSQVYFGAVVRADEGEEFALFANLLGPGLVNVNLHAHVRGNNITARLLPPALGFIPVYLPDGSGHKKGDHHKIQDFEDKVCKW